MKLLVQGDDYGFTKGVTYGIIEAIENGVLTATGMFTNMEIAPWAAQFIRERPSFCFGIDFNIVSGPSVSAKEDIPHLVDEGGQFIRSGVRLKDPRYKTEEGRRSMFPYNEVYREIKAQYNRFIDLTGRKPGYLHGHSIMHEHYLEAIRALSEETGVPFSMDITKKYGFGSLMDVKKTMSMDKKEFDPINQINKNPLKDVLDNSEYLLSKDYIMVGGHPGFVDADLFNLTTLSIERCKDLEMITSPKLKDWIKQNSIELISYYDLV